MARRKRRLIVVENSCKRGHVPIRIKKGNGQLLCYQCRKMQRRYERMIDRCYNPKNTKYKNYGGRGIGVCSRWRHSFANWYKDIGWKVDGKTHLTIDRINNDKGYSRRNCRVATTAEQNRNQRRSVLLTFDGVTQNQEDWANVLNVSSGRVSSRYRKTGNVEFALFGVLVLHTPSEVLIKIGGEEMNLSGWCNYLGYSIRTVEDRIYKFGWTYGQALGFSYRDGKCKPPPSI